MGHECGCHSGGAPAVLDVREMAPRIRHPKIFETFDALAPGAAFILVNDHDPKPLLYQFRSPSGCRPSAPSRRWVMSPITTPAPSR